MKFKLPKFRDWITAKLRSSRLRSVQINTMASILGKIYSQQDFNYLSVPVFNCMISSVSFYFFHKILENRFSILFLNFFPPTVWCLVITALPPHFSHYL